MSETRHTPAAIPEDAKALHDVAVVIQRLRAQAAKHRDWQESDTAGYNVAISLVVDSGDLLDEAADLLSAQATRLPARELLAWQPIETAPRYSTPFLVYWHGEPHIDMVAGWKEYSEIVGYGETPATHWLPLPAPPDTERSCLTPSSSITGLQAIVK